MAMNAAPVSCRVTTVSWRPRCTAASTREATAPPGIVNRCPSPDSSRMRKIACATVSDSTSDGSFLDTNFSQPRWASGNENFCSAGGVDLVDDSAFPAYPLDYAHRRPGTGEARVHGEV